MVITMLHDQPTKRELVEDIADELGLEYGQDYPTTEASTQPASLYRSGLEIVRDHVVGEGDHQVEVDRDELSAIRRVDTKPNKQVFAKTADGEIVQLGPDPWLFMGPIEDDLQYYY